MTKKSKLNNIVQKWDELDRWAKRILSAIATIGTVVGLVAGITGWVTVQLDSHLDTKIESITSKIEQLDVKSDAADKKLELSNTRLELTTLITHSPDNIIEIEKVARYYFIDLGGDWYMSQIYSDWAREYDGDLTFVTHIY